MQDSPFPEQMLFVLGLFTLIAVFLSVSIIIEDRKNKKTNSKGMVTMKKVLIAILAIAATQLFGAGSASAKVRKPAVTAHFLECTDTPECAGLESDFTQDNSCATEFGATSNSYTSPFSVKFYDDGPCDSIHGNVTVRMLYIAGTSRRLFLIPGSNRIFVETTNQAMPATASNIAPAAPIAQAPIAQPVKKDKGAKTYKLVKQIIAVSAVVVAVNRKKTNEGRLIAYNQVDAADKVADAFLAPSGQTSTESRSGYYAPTPTYYSGSYNNYPAQDNYARGGVMPSQLCGNDFGSVVADCIHRTNDAKNCRRMCGLE